MSQFVSRCLHWLVFASPVSEVLGFLSAVAYLVALGILVTAPAFAPGAWALWVLLACGVVMLLGQMPVWAHEPWAPGWLHRWWRDGNRHRP
ncbi:MAG TPA: hypothetical protein VKE26_26305 [Xanthobacteraceae bacterium]|nr:hypothetical protein [Xanthobacteraceae bacterium]